MNAEGILADAFLASHPGEASPVLERATAEACAAVLGRNPAPVIAGTLQKMAPTEAATVLTRLDDARTREVLAELPLGAAALMLRSLAAPERKLLLDTLPEETAKSIRTALHHAEGSAGTMMDSNVLAFPAGTNAGEARRRAEGRSRRTGNYLYVVDEARKLVGAVSVSELMLAAPGAPLGSLMRPTVQSLSADAPASTILDHTGWRELHALPVVDSGGVLVGILRRETYERLRAERDERGMDDTGGPAMALVELVWASMVSTLDELAGVAGGRGRTAGGDQDDT